MGHLPERTFKMKTALIVFACAIAFTQAASHDVEWKYGMTENELCVAPGDIVNFIWETNHNVDPVATKEDYDNCVFTNTEAEPGPWPGPPLRRRASPTWCAGSVSTAHPAIRSWPSL